MLDRSQKHHAIVNANFILLNKKNAWSSAVGIVLKKVNINLCMKYEVWTIEPNLDTVRQIGYAKVVS